MKKIWIILLVVLVGGIYGAYKIIDNANEYEKKQDKFEIQENTSASKEQSVKNQTSKIGGVQFDIGINGDSTEGEIIDVMHKMTHQKVKASEKWGAIPMTDETINEVLNIVTSSDYPHKEDLLSILDKWKNGQFKNVDSDHNYFWNYQGGTIGKAKGTLTAKEEEEFIKNNFQ